MNKLGEWGPNLRLPSIGMYGPQYIEIFDSNLAQGFPQQVVLFHSIGCTLKEWVRIVLRDSIQNLYNIKLWEAPTQRWVRSFIEYD